jgi:hypothetical protein
MTTTATTAPHVYVAISEISAELARLGISKERRNTQGAGFNFRGIDDVLDVLAPLLPKHGLCILPRAVHRKQEERQAKSGGALYYTDVLMEYDLVSAVDGSKHTISMFGEAMDSSDKSTNKAESAAYKYACFQGFCIPVQGTPDADAETPQAAPKTESKTSTQKTTAPSTNPGKPTITAATKKSLEGLRTTEAGERFTRELLKHWQMPDFDLCTEGEGKEALAWISAQVAAASKKEHAA